MEEDEYEFDELDGFDLMELNGALGQSVEEQGEPLNGYYDF